MSEDKKFYALVHPGGPGGALLKKPKMRKQDKRFKSQEFYAVVFFPKITGLPHAAANFYGISETLSNTPEAAKARFIDRHPSESWEIYHDAGHRVRKIKIIDMGDADDQAQPKR